MATPTTMWTRCSPPSCRGWIATRREFRPYWFETGTPTFLVKLLTERQVHTPPIGQTVAAESLRQR